MKNLLRILIVIVAILPLFVSAQTFIVCNPAPPSGTDCDFSKLILLANNIIKYCIVLGTSIFSIVFMYAGFLYMTARGDTGQISKAHGLFWDAIIGFVIMLAAWLLVDFILVSLVKNNPGNYRLLSK